MPLQIRRGTDAQRQILATPLASGELLWVTDSQQLFIGDGNTLANALTPVVGYNDENAQDAVGPMFDHAFHTDITYTYNDLAGRIESVVDISAFRQNVDMDTFDLTGSGNITTTGTVTAASFIGNYKGSIFGDDSTTLVDALNSSINLDGTVKGNIIPDSNEAYDLGSNSLRFKDLYLSGSSLFLGDAQITSSGTAVNLPAGSTINGEPLGEIAQPGNNLQVNIIGEDSSIIVDAANGNINAGSITASATVTAPAFIGDIQGSVFADNSTVMVDSVNNKFGTIVTDDVVTITAPDGDTQAIDLFGTSIGDDAIGPALISRSSKGSVTNPEPVRGDTFGDAFLDIRGEGWDGIEYQLSAGIKLATGLDATVAPGQVPGRIVMFTINETGGFTLDNLLIFNQQGRLGLGTNRPTEKLDVRGNIVSTGSITSSSITLDNNSIRTTNTNDNLQLSANGSGTVQLDVPTQSTVGAAGGANALPATPSTYFKINVGGTDYVVPAYAVS